MKIRAAFTVMCLSCISAPLMAQMQIGGGTCSSATLSGVYSLTLTGRDVNASLIFAKVLNGVGTATFDGQSKVTFSLTSNTNLASGTAATWTYTLQANCSGTLSLTNGETASLSLQSYNGGKSYIVTGEDGTFVFTGSGSLQPTAACSASLLNGSYTFNGSGFGLKSGAISVANNVSGVLQLDGIGAVTATWYVASSGSPAVTNSTGTFTLSGSCTGTASLSDSSGNNYALQFVVTAASGANFILTASNPLLMFSGSARLEPSTSTCSAATLTGPYSLVLTGRTISSTGALTGSFESTGTASFDGVGGVKFSLTANSTLSLGTPETLAGVYTLASNCVGTVNITTGDIASFTLVAYNAGKNYTITGGDASYPLAGSGSVQPSSCSASAASGGYAFTGSGNTTSRSGGTTTLTAANSISGLLNFDGRGNVTGSWTIATNAASASDTVSGQYSMSSSCVGTATVTDPSGAIWTLNFTVTSANSANIAADISSLTNIFSATAHATFTFPGLSVTSAASGASGYVPPGSIFALYGSALMTGSAQATKIPLPTTLLNTTVTVNGEAAPLFYVSATQINAQMPLDIPPGMATVVVTSGSSSSNSVAVNVPVAAPGIFVQYPTSQAVVQNQDFTVNTPASPAHVGDTVVAYFTGGGPVNASGPLVTGAASPANGPSPDINSAQVTVGGVQSTSILYAGLTPTLVGLYQVNFVIPQVSVGDHNLVLTINGISSTATTISIAK